MLKRGLAQPEDMLIMRHAGSDHDALRGKVGRLAKLSISDPPSGRRIELIKYEPRRPVREAPGIEQTNSDAVECSRVPDAPGGAAARQQTQRYGRT